jgi:ribonuclease P protein component
VFPRIQRLAATPQIMTVLRRGERIYRGAVSCYFLPKQNTLGRVTVIVSKDISKKAVDRNLLKRRTREILKSLTLPQGDLVVRFQKGANTLTYQELCNLVTKCLEHYAK